MKIKRIIILLFCSFSLGLFAQTEQLSITPSLLGNQGKLTLNHYKGKVKVSAYNGHVVSINAAVRTSGLPHDNNINKDIRLVATEENNEVVLICENREEIIDFDIVVPKNFLLVISTRYLGGIEVINIEGDVELKCEEGSIDLINVSGSAVLSTSSGDISASFEHLDKCKPIAATTLSGNIKMTLPTKIKASLMIKNSRGKVFSDFDFDKKKGQQELVVSGEKKTYSVNKWMTGDINGGGALYMFNTYSGDIHLIKN